MKSNANERPPGNPAADDGNLAAAVARAIRQPSLPGALAEIYRSVDAEIERLDLTCMGGGACCRFDIADHRLFATTAELAYLLADGPAPEAPRPQRCPYQMGPRCTARAARPLGCRVYFCAPAAPDAVNGLYDRFHRLICLLHNTLGVEYRYVELTEALAGLGPGLATPSCDR